MTKAWTSWKSVCWTTWFGYRCRLDDWLPTGTALKFSPKPEEDKLIPESKDTP